MKLLTLFALLFATSISFGQQNTIPVTGNVGLGTMNPSAKLDVNGKAIIDSTLTVKDSVLFKNCLHVEQELRVDGQITMMENSVAKENLKVQGTLKLPNLSNPNSIGSNQLLMVKDNGAVVKSDIPSLNKELHLEIACSQTYINNPYWMNGTNKLFTGCPETKVGIGTNSPEFSLDVRGTGYFENSIRVGTPFNAPLPAYFEGYAALVNSRPWMRLTTLDNGTDKTAFLIKKNGNVYCTALRVRYTDDIPDYVFKPDYKLMPLRDVKSFVSANSHLPNIPSEAEIRKDGLSIEKMQMKLLEKVEELTLYVIQLEEQRIDQAEKLNKLQEEVNILKTESTQSK